MQAASFVFARATHGCALSHNGVPGPRSGGAIYSSERANVPPNARVAARVTRHDAYQLLNRFGPENRSMANPGPAYIFHWRG